jgi:hypothetical protein
MLRFDQLKGIHIEITSRCQASCPMCNRNLYGGLKNPNLVLSDWTLDDFKNIFDEEVVNQLFQVLFCGHFGDPLINPHFLDMVRYLKEVNPNIMVNVHTNGSFYKEDWWTEFAKVIPRFHSVHIGIDGLEDTHSIYRIGTDWNKIIKNSKAFIDAGGIATWEFIRFKHNEHQVEACRELSKELGFAYFAVKDTSRYIDNKPYKVLDKDGNLLYHLEQPSDTTVAGVDEDIVKNYKNFVKESTIDCMALRMTQFYIDVNKHLYPCGFLGQTQMAMTDYGDMADSLRRESTAENQEVFKRFPTLDLTKSSIKEIINSKEWQTVWDEYIHGDKRLLTCVRNCGRFSRSLTHYEEETIDKKPNI